MRQGFAKNLLEVADNLESAQKAIPADILQPGADVPADKALGYLKSLLEGVQATEKVLHKVRERTCQLWYPPWGSMPLTVEGLEYCTACLAAAEEVERHQ